MIFKGDKRGRSEYDKYLTEFPVHLRLEHDGQTLLLSLQKTTKANFKK